MKCPLKFSNGCSCESQECDTFDCMWYVAFRQRSGGVWNYSCTLAVQAVPLSSMKIITSNGHGSVESA